MRRNRNDLTGRNLRAQRKRDIKTTARIKRLAADIVQLKRDLRFLLRCVR